MQRKYIVVLTVAAGVLLLSFGRKNKNKWFVVPKRWPRPAYNFKNNPLTEDGIKLGRALFFDPMLSRDSTISCASCHAQYTGFTHSDHNLSHGIDGRKGTRNSSALANLAWNTSFMWDGGVNNLEVQPLNPISNPTEMDSKLPDVVAKLNGSAKYRRLFYKAFKDSAVTSQHMLKALAQFMLTLESYNSKYDKVMRGEGEVFTAEEQNGYVLFKEHCASCHTEPLFTNNEYRYNGLPVDTELNDMGRMKVTQNSADSVKFKVPSLRNIFVSGPYMHDGRFRVLEQVLDHYTKISNSPTLAPELASKIALTKKERLDIIYFLRTLTDREFLNDERFKYSAD